MERQLADIANEEKQASCICHAFLRVSYASAENFRAEMNRVCPAHGFRELDIFRIVYEADDSDSEVARDTEINELLMEYKRRLVEARQAA